MTVQVAVGFDSLARIPEANDTPLWFECPSCGGAFPSRMLMPCRNCGEEVDADCVTECVVCGRNLCGACELFCFNVFSAGSSVFFRSVGGWFSPVSSSCSQ